MVAIHSWGRLQEWEHTVVPLAGGKKTIEQVQTTVPGIAFGNGRSYGDVCVNPGGTLWQCQGLNRFLDFDAEAGQLTCEAGVLFSDIQQTFVPRGWILPIPLGTQAVTVGGAIGNDIHGKNHHVAGSFGNHIVRLGLLRTDGTLLECSPEENPDMFAATIGGLGLTGIILNATIQLRKVDGPWLDVEHIPYANLDEFFTLSDTSEATWEHTVGWIDCLSGALGRGIFMRGNYASSTAPSPKAKYKLAVPFTPPLSLINKVSLMAFNTVYYHWNKAKAGRKRVHYEPFFYPLDNILEWNRIYGPRGFYQYQSVVPRSVGKEAVAAMLREIAASGTGSFLAVLKTFGSVAARGMLSFPQEGVTLALDFPNLGSRTETLFTRLDAIVREAKGRLYPAKDARMPKDLFVQGYPRLQEFMAYRDPGVSSALARRLL